MLYYINIDEYQMNNFYNNKVKKIYCLRVFMYSEKKVKISY